MSLFFNWNMRQKWKTRTSSSLNPIDAGGPGPPSPPAGCPVPQLVPSMDISPWPAPMGGDGGPHTELGRQGQGLFPGDRTKAHIF